jgi:poly[(R)-3-hydroxyalkanoate] polymerase subunit PhaC
MIRAGRKTVSLRMPVKGESALPLQTVIEQIGRTPPRAERQPRHSSSSELDRWVQYGRVADRGPTTFTPSSDHALTRDPERACPELDPGRQPASGEDHAQTNRSGRDGDAKKGHLALVAAIDNICERRTRTRPTRSRGRHAANASDAPSKFVSIADIAAPQHASAIADKAPNEAAPTDTIDIEQLSRNFFRLMEQGGKAMAACLKPHDQGRLASEVSDAVGVVRTLGHVAEYWLAHPQRAIEAQANLGKAYVDLWVSTTKRMFGDQVEPVATPDPKDRRFADPEWRSNAYFDFLKQAYLLTSDWANRVVQDTRGVDAHTRQKAEFYLRQLTDALSPANFVLTNPELLRKTLSSNAGNLVSGMRMLAEDIETGHGRLKIRQTDAMTFEVGRNLAITPGKVIHQNELMQLIQYVPTTSTVLKRPILIVPPWINKYYILDLTPEKSFVKWCVDQGLTVFVISWVNPDAKLAAKGFDDYMREGPLEALEIIATVTGEEKVHTIGYCAGGTLLATMLAYMAAKGDERALSATLLATQVDFTYAGNIMAFIDEEQIESLERQMSKTGFLKGHMMAESFNLLRSNDLIWPYVINNYLKGEAPRPFDLLHWNSDATRIPVACHSFYLRNCYLDNTLAKGEMTLAGETIDLGNVTVPLYSLAAREDHIAPAKSVFLGCKLFGGPVKFVVAGSGHIAGVINPPYQIKYSHWTDGPGVSNIETWLAKAEERRGSWWPNWLQWIRDQDPTEVPARNPGCGGLKPLEEAPGSYVKVKA